MSKLSAVYFFAHLKLAILAPASTVTMQGNSSCKEEEGNRSIDPWHQGHESWPYGAVDMEVLFELRYEFYVINY